MSNRGNNTGKSQILFDNFPNKKNNKFRLIIDMSVLNSYILYGNCGKLLGKSERHNCSQLLGIFIGSDRCIFACLDTSEIPQIPSNLSKGKSVPVYQFKALHFRLITIPFVFTCLMEVIATFLHQLSITLISYPGNWLTKIQNVYLLKQQRQLILQLILSLDRRINMEKSDLNLSSNFKFIGKSSPIRMW